MCCSLLGIIHSAVSTLRDRWSCRFPFPTRLGLKCAQSTSKALLKARCIQNAEFQAHSITSCSTIVASRNFYLLLIVFSECSKLLGEHQFPKRFSSPAPTLLGPSEIPARSQGWTSTDDFGFFHPNSLPHPPAYIFILFGVLVILRP
jgi:hypothetical protein